MVTVFGGWPDEQIVVIQVRSTLYRVLKASVERSEPPLLGFIRGIGDLFETTAVGEPLRRTYWATLEQAVGELHVRQAAVPDFGAAVQHTRIAA